MRITGGIFRSRRLEAPKGERTRPTSDRVREAMFSMLAADGLLPPGARVLDLYAGTGALAFEALSRGAAEAILVEEGAPAIAAIRANAEALGVAERSAIVRGPVLRMLARIEGAFDLILVDPPYRDVRASGFVDLLARAAEKLAEGGALVLEHAAGDPAPAVRGLTLDRSRTHGDTAVSLYRKTSLP
jgi:16S rRNA (guanine966-N2)-methyltransferase